MPRKMPFCRVQQTRSDEKQDVCVTARSRQRGSIPYHSHGSHELASVVEAAPEDF